MSETNSSENTASAMKKQKVIHTITTGHSKQDETKIKEMNDDEAKVLHYLLKESGVRGRIVDKPVKVVKKSLTSEVVDECELYMAANGGKRPYKIFCGGIGKFFDRVSALEPEYIDEQACYAEHDLIDAEKTKIMDARMEIGDANQEFEEPHIVQADDRLSAIGVFHQVKLLYNLMQTFGAEVFVSDPIFEETDRKFLEKLGFNVVEEADENKLNFSINKWSGGSIILFTPFLPCEIMEALGEQISELNENTKLVIITGNLNDQRKCCDGCSYFCEENFIKLKGTENCMEAPITGVFEIYGWTPVKKMNCE